MKFWSILDLSYEQQLNESGLYTIPGVKHWRDIQMNPETWANLTKQWQVVFLITILPSDTSELIF